MNVSCNKQKINYLKCSLEGKCISRASCSEFQMLVNSTCTCSLDCSIVSLNKLDKKNGVGRVSCNTLVFQISRELQYSGIEKEM